MKKGKTHLILYRDRGRFSTCCLINHRNSPDFLKKGKWVELDNASAATCEKCLEVRNKVKIELQKALKENWPDYMSTGLADPTPITSKKN